MAATMTWTEAKAAYETARDAMLAAPKVGPGSQPAAKTYYASVKALVRAADAAVAAGAFSEADDAWLAAESAKAPRHVSTAWMI